MGAETLDVLSTEEEDFSGRDRMTRNVITSWGGHLVYIVAGFIMPRLIDSHLGQAELGLWDFGWTIVSYFGLAGIGVGSSVNRFVAKCRVSNDVEGLRSAVSSVAVVQIFGALVVLVATAVVTWQLPRLFGNAVGANQEIARWVVALLGLNLAVQMAFDYFRGVMTGCHRWDLHNAINSGSYALAVVAMIVALRTGGGLRSLAFVNLCGSVAAEAVRAVCAFRVCPELRVAVAYASWARIREMTAFGGKTLTNGIARLLLLQANSLLVAGHFGAAVLAVYQRPMALIRHVETLTSKFSFVLTPTASSLQGAGNDEDLRTLFIKSTRFAAFLALPMILTLSILGDSILYLWMGARYEEGPLLALLAAGAVLPVTQQPGVQILTGLNLHGRLSMAAIVAAVGGVFVGMIAVGSFGLGLYGAALALGLAMTAGNGIFVAAYACRKLRVPMGRYVLHAYARPVACVLPFAGCLVATRWQFSSRPLVAVLVGGAVGGAVLIVTYWRYVLPGLRERMR